MNSFYDIPHPDVFVHLRNATQQLASSIPEANILLSNVVSSCVIPSHPYIAVAAARPSSPCPSLTQDRAPRPL